MKHTFLLLTVILLFVSCKTESKKEITNTPEVSELTTDFAKGFIIKNHKGYKTITITNPWPGAEKEFLKFAEIEVYGMPLEKPFYYESQGACRVNKIGMNENQHDEREATETYMI